MSYVFSLIQGQTPILVSMPHTSSGLPAALAARMHPYAQSSPDTDWLISSLYDFAEKMKIGILQPEYSRYLIDLNRPPDNQNLYPGANSTGLCPLTCFDQRPIYLEGQEPDQPEIQARIELYWQPYHRALQSEIERLKSIFGLAIVFDAHSIASRVPRFFEGKLPDLNLGTAQGTSCAPELQTALEKVLQGSSYPWVSNERFQGGYITRAYGSPADHVHTVQLELSQSTYLEEETGTWLAGKAARIQPVLQHLLQTILDWSLAQQS